MNTHISYILVEIKVSCCIHWQGKQKYQHTNIGMKSNATKGTKLKIKYHNKFKTVLTNGNCKLFLGKPEHETYTLLRLCLIKFLNAHIFCKGEKALLTTLGKNSRGEDLRDYCIRAVKITLCTIWDCFTSFKCCRTVKKHCDRQHTCMMWNICCAYDMRKNCCLFEKLFKVKKNGVFLFGKSFFVLGIFTFLY